MNQEAISLSSSDSAAQSWEAASSLNLEGSDVKIRKALLSDARAIFKLYTQAAHDNPGHLLREENEVTVDYIHSELHNSLHRGLTLVVELEEHIIGYFNAYTSEDCCLAHVLTKASNMIDPAWQERGLGGTLLEAYLQKIRTTMPHIYRFELFAHQSNHRAINFYEHHGFIREGEAVAKIRTAAGGFESEVTLVWFNPDFSEQQLKVYQAELDCQL